LRRLRKKSARRGWLRVEIRSGDRVRVDVIAVDGIVVDGIAAVEIVVGVIAAERGLRRRGMAGWMRCGSGLLLVVRGRRRVAMR